MDRCKICKSGKIKSKINPENDSSFVSCPNCGHYIISETALECDLNQPQELLNIFSGYILNHSSKKNRFQILSKTFEDMPTLIEPYNNLSGIDKSNLIINYLAENSKQMGDTLQINLIHSFSRFYCRGLPEFVTILGYLYNKKYIHYSGELSVQQLQSVANMNNDYLADISLSFEGWNKYEELLRPNQDKKQVFIAMNFDKEYDTLYEKAIAPACSSCGYIPYRIDKTEHNEKICNKIIAEIKKSRFLIADFTGQKQGVYYEAGFAEGIGLDVIRCCKKEEIDNNDLHFDTRQYNHIPWETIDELKNKLIDRIQATIT